MFQNQAVMVIGGIAIIVAIIVIAMLTGGSSNAPTSHKEPNWIMWVVLAIIPLLALQIYGKGGAVVTAMIGVLALIAVVLLGNNISRSYTYGDKAEEVLQHQREVAAKKALAEVTAPAVPTAPIEAPIATIRVTLTKEPSAKVRVIEGRCIFFWMEDGRNRPEVTEVQILDTSKWLTIEEFFALPDTSPKKIALVRWSGTGTLAYELRPDGQCSSK